jgi:non-canonical poly(A) RNA polymerase PAPD5/7
MARLHKEIVDFYDYVRPREFEERIRGELVQSLRQLCRNYCRDADVAAFGSFPSGLYLPTGDMDLVFLSDQFKNGGLPKYNNKKDLYKMKNHLIRSQVVSGEVQCITRAKVPLVKYVDRLTGLRMDMSFENLTGVDAIATFKAWREQYPVMPVLVTLIKQLLAMRGLNEPVNGGIGGFSVICLVVSLLQQTPEIQSGNMNPHHHLAQGLMTFLDFYGNHFNYKDVAISLNPPSYMRKVSCQPHLGGT